MTGPAALSRDAEELLSWLAVERGRSANTLAAYRRDLEAYEAFLASRKLALGQVSEAVVEDYVAFLRAAGRRPASVARALVAVRSLHRFCLDEGRAASDPRGKPDLVCKPLISRALSVAPTYVAQNERLT